MESPLPPLNLLRHRAFIFLWISRVLSSVGTLTQSIALGWQVYVIARLTHDIEYSAFLVGMVGLAQFLPLFAVTLIAGEAIDRYDRRHILLLGTLVQIFCAAGLWAVAVSPHPSLVLIFSLAAVYGVVRAFVRPASTALWPMLVPRELMPKAVAWSSLSIQIVMILGPWLGGVLCAIAVPLAYQAACAVFVLSGLAAWLVRGNTKPDYKGGKRLALIREGLVYVWRNKIVFGAISLDLFAVLLGGVTALLPVYARDILQVGPDGFGLLRSATAIGGGVGALWLARYPLQRHAGIWMLSGVGLFGVATIVFGLSTSIWVSFVSLMVLGAADVVSMFVRQSLVQIVTPDSMRGRVSAVSTLFISASNELGEFESGVVARLIGPVGSAVFGGLGSIGVMLAWAKLFPELRKVDRLLQDEKQERGTNAT